MYTHTYIHTHTTHNVIFGCYYTNNNCKQVYIYCMYTFYIAYIIMQPSGCLPQLRRNN